VNILLQLFGTILLGKNGGGGRRGVEALSKRFINAVFQSPHRFASLWELMLAVKKEKCILPPYYLVEMVNAAMMKGIGFPPSTFLFPKKLIDILVMEIGMTQLRNNHGRLGCSKDL